MSVNSLQLLCGLMLLFHCYVYSYISTPGTSMQRKIYFKKKSDDNNSNNDNILSRIIRFLPGFRRVEITKSYDEALPDTGNRYMLRLIQPKNNDRRHCITRLTRFLPDLTFETAADIVDLALIEGISLVRVFNSIKEAEYLAKMLRKADPPVNVQVYDSKTDQIVY